MHTSFAKAMTVIREGLVRQYPEPIEFLPEGEVPVFGVGVVRTPYKISFGMCCNHSIIPILKDAVPPKRWRMGHLERASNGEN